jgi:ribosomal protein S18 acetylase RimI-like enzyme
MPLATGARPEPIKILIEPLDSSHDRGAFVCASTQKIQNYIRNNALKDHDLYKVRVYVAVRPNSKAVIGYYSLVLTALEPALVSEEAENKFSRVRAVPAIYLAMLGVSDECAGAKIGKNLTKDAIVRAITISEIAGAYAIALDALDDEVADMYAALGFEKFVEGERKMFLALAVARAAAKS